MTASDVAPRDRFALAGRNLTVELFDGANLAAVDWPSITTEPELQMHVFQSREFLGVWMTTIGRARGTQAYLAVVRDGDNRPALYLPLAVETRYNVRLLRFMDAGVADYNAPILAAGQSLSRQEFGRAWADILALLPKVDAIDLQKISGNVSGLANPLTYLECEVYQSSGHAIRLGRLGSEIHARPTVTRMRRKLQRRHEKLSELGETNFIVDPSGAGAAHIIDALFELKHKHYMRTGRDFFAMPGVSAFYREMTTPAKIGRISSLSALTCGGKVVAAHLGFIGRGQFYYILPAYDTEYRPFTVGHMLLDSLIEHCCDEQRTTFDLGEGDFPYKDIWATDRLPLYSYERAMTAAGLLYLQMRRVRRRVAATRIHDWYSGIRDAARQQWMQIEPCPQ